MKPLLFILLVTCSYYSRAQLCPGGGVNFSTAVTFDPAWIYGCNTGTSCNGGVNFDNRTACLPITAMDLCAPAPSCGNILNNASNEWFKFYAAASTAMISCFQNTSFVIGVQAFNGGPACGSLTEIGCAMAGGPSSGVILNLSGLTPGKLYYFRIFGNATPVSQRTGLFCFCGTTGLSNFILPVGITGFKASVYNQQIQLTWNNPGANNIASFDLERSADGISFDKIDRINAAEPGAVHFSYRDAYPTPGTIYYRLKEIGNDGHFTYSTVISIQSPAHYNFTILPGNSRGELRLLAAKKELLTLYNIAGQLVQTIAVQAGLNTVSLSGISRGVYLLHSKESNTVKKLYILN